MDKSICPEEVRKMTVQLELRQITAENQANHAMIYCEEEECKGMIAIGMLDSFFGNLETAKEIALLHNETEGCETHPVKLVLQNLVR